MWWRPRRIHAAPLEEASVRAVYLDVVELEQFVVTDAKLEATFVIGMVSRATESLDRLQIELANISRTFRSND